MFISPPTHLQTQTHTYTYTRTHTLTYLHTHAHARAYTHTHAHKYTHTNTHTRTHTHTHTNTHAHTHTQIHTHAHTRTCLRIIARAAGSRLVVLSVSNDRETPSKEQEVRVYAVRAEAQAQVGRTVLLAAVPADLHVHEMQYLRTHPYSVKV